MGMYPPILAFGDALLGTAEVLAAWWAYRRLGGALRVIDPRSAVLFVLVVPGLAAAAFAVARAALACAVLGRWADFGPSLAQTWLSGSLGLLTVAPPLLTAATPWLVRRGLVRPEVVSDKPTAAVGHAGADRLTRGDAVEIAGLALGAGILALVLACTYGRQGLEGWQPWGAPLLLVVWASLRQGQRGGVLTTGLAAALPLCFLTFLAAAPPPFAYLIQGNLLGLAGAGLLAAAAAGWVRINERRYRQVVTHVPVVVYSGRILRGGNRPAAEVTLVSDASGALLGCPPEQLLGDHRRWLDRVHPDDREVVLAALAQLGRQKEPVACEYRLAPPPQPAGGAAASRTPIGPRWVRDILAPQFDAEGRLSGWDGVVMEVTEQRAMAVDLRRTTSMFQALVANLPAGVFFVQGPTGHPILVNNRARQLLGRREEPAAGVELLSKVYHLHRPDGSPYPVEELPVFQALRRGATAMRDDVVVHRPDGRRVPLVTWAAPVRLGGPGQADAAVWVLEDLTALHQAEAARRDTEGRLRTVVETMGEGLIVQDRNRVVVDCNAAACAAPPHAAANAGDAAARVLVLPARGRLGLARRGTSGPGGAADGPAGAELRAGPGSGGRRGRPALVPRQRHAAGRRRRDGRGRHDPVRRHGAPAGPGSAAAVGGEVPRPDRGDAAHAGPGRPGPACRIRQPRRARRNRIRDGGNSRPVGVGALRPPRRPAARAGRRRRGPRRPAGPHGVPL